MGLFVPDLISETFKLTRTGEAHGFTIPVASQNAAIAAVVFLIADSGLSEVSHMAPRKSAIVGSFIS